MHRLSEAEGLALASLALALRPDWARNQPGRMLRAANDSGGLVPAVDFEHCVRALLAYAASGKRAPDLYLEDGPYWRDTLPRPPTVDRAAEARERAMRARPPQAPVPPPPWWAETRANLRNASHAHRRPQTPRGFATGHGNRSETPSKASQGIQNVDHQQAMETQR